MLANPVKSCTKPLRNNVLQRAQFYPSTPFAANAPISNWRLRLKLHLSDRTSKNIFTAHGTGYVTVNGQRYEQSIVVTPEQVLSNWPAQKFETLTEADFSYFLTLHPEVLLLGTGQQHRFAHPGLYRALTNAGISVEFMATPAACRTYNILMAEDRKVVAGILL